MTRLTRMTLDNPSITLLLMLALVVSGFYAAFTLNQELVPDIQPPQATILVAYPGASADEVTASVIEPIEDAAEAISDIDVLEIASTASENIGIVSIVSEFGTSQDDIEAAIEEALDDVTLPEDAEAPEILLFRFSDIPVLQASVSGEIARRDLQALLEDEVVPELEAIEGVSEVSLTGTSEDRIFLRLDPEAMDDLGVSLQDIRSALDANDLSFPAGTLTDEGRITPLQVTNRITSTRLLERLVIKDPSASNGPPGAGAGQMPPGFAGVPRGPFPIPGTVRAQAAAVGVSIETTDDLTPELVAQLEAIDPGLLRNAAVEIVDSLPPGGLAALPADVIAALPDDLQRELAEMSGVPLPQAAAGVGVDDGDAGGTEGDDDGEPDTGDEPAAGEEEAAGDDGEGEGDTDDDGEGEGDGEGDGVGDGEPARTVRIVVVQPGESAASIAARFGTSPEAIEEENGLDAGEFPEPGALLRVPIPDDVDRLPPVWRLAGADEPADITPEVLETVVAAAPSAVSELTPEQLVALPPETIQRLPAAFLARQEDRVREALVARRDGRELPDLDRDAAEEVGDEDGDDAGRDDVDGEGESESEDGRDGDDDEVPDDGLVRLGDIASVEIAPEEAETINRTDRQTSVGLIVLKEGDANTVSVVRAVEERIAEIQDETPEFDRLEFKTIFEQASFIEESLSGVINEGLLGGIFAVIVILIFLFFSLRATLIVAVSIPLSILTALLLMKWQGLSLNLLTLSGLTIAIGRVVDDSIVVLENLFRNIQQGASTREALIEATREVAAAITTATLVTVAVFLPLGFIGGLTREFFLPFALTTSYALLASLIVALTVIPLLTRWLLSEDTVPHDRETALQRAYTPIVRWALDHRLLTLGLAVAFFVLSLGLRRFIPTTFLPSFGEPSVTVELTLPPGTDLQTTDAVTRLVEDIVDAEEQIFSFETTIGRGAEIAGFGQVSGADRAKSYTFASFRADEADGPFAAWLDDEVDAEAVAVRLRHELRELNDIDEISRRLEDLGEEGGIDDPEGIARQLERQVAEANLDADGATDVFEFVVSSAAVGGPPAGAYDLLITGDNEADLHEATELILAALTDPEEWEDEEGYDLTPDDEEDEDGSEESFFERLFGSDEDDESDEDADAADDETTAADGRDELEFPIINLSSNLTEARQVLSVDVDPAKALARGLSPAAVAFALRPVLDPEDVGAIEIEEDGELRRIDVKAEYPSGTISDKASLEAYEISNQDGEKVALSDIATVELRDGAVEITRSGGQRSAKISGEILDEDTFGVTAAAGNIIERVKRDNRALFGDEDDDDEDRRVTVSTGVNSQQQQDGFNDMLRVVPISIGIAYLFLVLLFRSLMTPLIVLLSLPFAVSGAFIALAITQRPLGISSLIGMLALIGIVVTNAVVLLDFVKQMQNRGVGVRTALIEGGRLRVRPILMTALATGIALVPLAIGLTEGALIASELATTVIGGLITSTALTLVVVPVLYSLAADLGGDSGDGEGGGDGDGGGGDGNGGGRRGLGAGGGSGPGQGPDWGSGSGSDRGPDVDAGARVSQGPSPFVAPQAPPPPLRRIDPPRPAAPSAPAGTAGEAGVDGGTGDDRDGDDGDEGTTTDSFWG